MKNKISETSFTKRELLSITASIYDPMGMISPFVIQAKWIFQELWKDQTWDEQITGNLVEEWKKWIRQIDEIDDVKIPRHLGVKSGSDVTLHVFGDASMKAYGAVAYIMSTDENITNSTFCMAKSRVAPKKELTLPKLELMAALLASRISLKVRSCLKIESYYLWTDSEITLGWIKNGKKRKNTFVENRIREIRKNSDESCWKHIQGKENPADKITRGEDVSKLKTDMEWWHGPHWLLKSQSTWPKQKMQIDEEIETKYEEVMLITGVSCILD